MCCRPRERLHHHGQKQRREAGRVGVRALQRLLELWRNLIQILEKVSALVCKVT